MAADRARTNGLAAEATVKKILVDSGWEPEETDEEAVYRVDFSTAEIPISELIAKVRVERERFILLFKFRDRASPELRVAVAEFLTRANSGMVVGNFEMDYDEGSIAFKVSIDFTLVELSERLVRNAIRSGMDVVEYYADSLVAVVQGKMSAMAAIQAAEAQPDG